MAISFVAAGPAYQSGTATTTTGVITSPTSAQGVQAGDFLILHVATTVTAIPTLSGVTTWNQLEANWSIGSPGPAHITFYKIADSADLAGSSTTVTMTSAQRMAGYIIALRGVDPTTPKDVTSPAGTKSATATPALPATPITTVTAGAWVLCLAAAVANTGVTASDWSSTVMTERATAIVSSTGGNPLASLFTAVVATPGTFQPDLALTSDTGRSSVLTVALRPAASLPSSGSASGTWTFTGTAVGQRDVSAWSAVASATTAPASEGAATGTWTFTGAANGHGTAAAPSKVSVWTGSTWQLVTPLKWNGTTWVPAPITIIT